jgi:hypothetical protein
MLERQTDNLLAGIAMLRQGAKPTGEILLDPVGQFKRQDLQDA